MARPRYPSDEARLQKPPGISVAFSIRNPDNAEQAKVFTDPELRGIWAGLLVIAGQAFAGRTNDRVTLSLGDLVWLTGRRTQAGAESALTRVCAHMGYDVTSDSGRSWTVHVRNLSQNQGWTPQARGATPRTPSASEIEIEIEIESEKIKNLPHADPSAPQPAEPIPAAALGRCAAGLFEFEPPDVAAEPIPPPQATAHAGQHHTALQPPDVAAPPTAKRRRAAKPAAPAKAPQPSARAIAIFCEEFKASQGINPPIPPRDFRELGQLLEQLGEKDFRNAATVYFDFGFRKDEWIRKQGYSAREFIRQITKMHSIARERGRGGGSMKPKSIAEQEAEWNRAHPLTAEQMAEVFECSLDEAAAMLGQAAVPS